MPTVYLDTSVAMNDAFLKSAYSEAFLKACAILQYTVVMPDIVVDELKGNFPKKLKDKLDAFLKAKRELGKLTDLEAPTISLSEAVDSYEGWLGELIDKHGIVVAPYPEVSAKELVEQSYHVKKPFKESGEGHKDYVVWKTILGHITEQGTTSSNIFLTNNTKDFCDLDKDGTPVLHSDLAEQIENPISRPKVYTSIKSAFDSEVSPKLEGLALDDIPDLGQHDLDTMVGEFLLEDLPSRSLYGLEGLPFNDEVSISSIGGHLIESVTLKKVDEEVVIYVTGNIEIEADGFINKFDYYHHDNDEASIWVVDGNWNDHVMLVSASIQTDFELTIFYSVQSSEVTGHETLLPQEIEDEWPYK
ncbi:MAG: PIN domain-containing protein [Sphingorhabdus sp.]|uniref:PIN domain-containing protein n=1 Tax=Sphingorhabdus sp. TaxID=1902408 RepID=UPI003C9DB23D